MAETWIEIVYNDFWFATIFRTSCELPRVEDFEQLRHVVSAYMS